MERSKELLADMNPCDADLYNADIRTVDDAKAIGEDYCPKRKECMYRQGKGEKVACTLRFGKDVAMYVSQGSKLEAELKELSDSGLFGNGRTFLNSADRKTFEEIEGAEKILSEVKRVAEALLA